MGDPTRKKLKFYNTRTHKVTEEPVDRIVERAKGGWIAEAHDEEGTKLTKFVKRGTKL